MNAKKVAVRYGMLSADEVDALHKCAKMIGGEQPVFINIGAGMGTSTLAFLEANQGAYVIEIDIKQKELAKKHTAAYNSQHRLIRVIGRSQDVGQNWPFPVDLVFVDGLHTDAGVVGDIEAWQPKIKPGGIIIFHDYHHPNLPNLTKIVDRRMAGLEVVAEARYLIAYRIGKE